MGAASQINEMYKLSKIQTNHSTTKCKTMSIKGIVRSVNTKLEMSNNEENAKYVNENG